MSDSDMDSGDGDEQLIRFALHDAAEAGNASAIHGMLHLPAEGEEPARINPLAKLLFTAKDVLGCNPLHVAILRGQVQCAEELLSAGMSASGRCDGCPPLNMAACLAMHPGRAETALQLIQLLLQHEASPTDVDDWGRTVLHWAAAVGLPQAIEPVTAVAARERTAQLEAYQAAAAADPDSDLPTHIDHLTDVKDNDGNTALALAARHGHADVIRQLLTQPSADNDTTTTGDREAACKVRNKEGFTPLHLAARHGHVSAVRALLAHGPKGQLTVQDRRGRTALQLAQVRGHKAVAQCLTEASAGTKHTSAAVPQPAHQSVSVSCKIIAPEECFLHRTAPEPYKRGMASPPPENVHRLRVLLDPGLGVLRGSEFASLVWQTHHVPSATMSDVLRCHEWAYVRQIGAECAKIPDAPEALGHLDGDTAISHHSYLAAFKAAGACCQAVDDVMAGRARSVFCAVRPPGHHAGPLGVVRGPHDPHGSHGFCLLSNIAIAAGYAMNAYRHAGVKRVVILDFDVHHGNGTEAVVANVIPTIKKVPIHTPFAEGHQSFPTFKPWLDISDKDNILFASVQGYGRHPFSTTSWFYPGSGATVDTRPPHDTHTGTHAAGSTADPAAAGAHATGAVVASGKGGGSGGRGGDVEMQDANGAQDVSFPEDPDGEFSGHTHDPVGEGAGHGPRIINVGIPGPGNRRQMWRRAWRDKILPAVANFRPDIIFVSAGFDAHKKDDINIKFVGITEAEYEWLTDQITQLANRFCQGRIVSVLEGGYNLNGGCCSPLARSVAAHVRALAEPHTQHWDPEESKAEREAEARKRAAAAEAAAAEAAALAADAVAEDAAASAAPVKLEPHAPDSTAAAPAAAAAAAAPAASAPAPAAVKSEPAAQPPAAPAAPAAAAAAASPDAGGSRAKRARRGEPVDYVALNAKLEAERAAGSSNPAS